jgi:hypothetical protein
MSCGICVPSLVPGNKGEKVGSNFAFQISLFPDLKASPPHIAFRGGHERFVVFVVPIGRVFLCSE